MPIFKFRDKKIPKEVIENKPEYDLSLFYEKANDDLLIQQGNIDKVFTSYITIVSFATPYTLTANAFGTPVTSMLLLMIGLVGLALSFIAMGYSGRCTICEISMHTLTYLMNIKKGELNPSIVRAACYQTMVYEMDDYIYLNYKNKKKFHIKEIISDSLFKGENSYISIMIFASLLFLLIADFSALAEIGITINAQNALYYSVYYLVYGALILLTIAAGYYFCIVYNIFAVVITNKERDFNRTFGKMKYLRFCRKRFYSLYYDIDEEDDDDEDEDFGLELSNETVD